MAAGDFAGYLLFDESGVATVRDESVDVVREPVTWAADDGARGVLYVPEGDAAEVLWLPAGERTPLSTGLGIGAVPAVVDDEPALVHAVEAVQGGDCGIWEPDGTFVEEVRVLEDLRDPQSRLLFCAEEGQDDWYVYQSFVDDRLLAVHAFAAGSQQSDGGLVLFDERGERVELPDTVFSDQNRRGEPQELSARLGFDGETVAVRQRSDACCPPDPATGEVDVDRWARETLAIPAEMRVVDLATGEIRYQTTFGADAQLTDFDGRFAVIAELGVLTDTPERAATSTVIDTRGELAPWSMRGGVRLLRPLTGGSPAPWPTSAPPTIQHGDIGPWVSFLQQQLVRGGWPVDVDGRFGPDTDAALRGAQEATGLAPDGVTDEATWTALTSPSTPMHVLRPDGIGTVDFGAAATEALGALSELFGEPDRQTLVDPDRECVEGSPWSDCVPVVDDARIVSWSARGLDVLFTDAGADGSEGASHFGAWHVVAATAPPTLSTMDGLAARATVADLRRVDPDVQFFTNEGVVDVFTVETPTGAYLGTLAWDSYAQHVQALQKTLNAYGADLAADGTPGPRTEQACREFAAAEGLVTDGCPDGWLTDELADALGLPPPDIHIASLSAEQH